MISIVVPCKNRVEDLIICLKSIEDSLMRFQENDSVDYEIIVSDDHSNQGFTEKILVAFPNIKICHSKGEGPGYARNDAFELSKGEYIFFTDSDCKVDDMWIEFGYKALNDGHLIVQGNPCLFQKKNSFGKEEEKLYTVMFSSYVTDDGVTMTDSRNLLINRKISEKLGNRIFAEEQNKATAESRVFAYRCIENGVPIFFAEDVKVYHKDPNTIMESCKQKFRHGMGRRMFWLKKQDFDMLDYRYFQKPITSGVDKMYDVFTHACFLLGFFEQFKSIDTGYYELFLTWLKDRVDHYMYEGCYENELKVVMNDVLRGNN